MDKFPQMVLRFPGQLPDATALQDGTYDTHVVHDEAELKAALTDGWFETAAEAKTTFIAKRDAAEAAARAATEAANNKPPTRAELEAKATELGIAFDAKLDDKKLGKLIADKLKA